MRHFSKPLFTAIGIWMMLIVNISTPASATEQSTVSSDIGALDWVHGPAILQIGDQATVKLPTGYMYLDEENSKRFLELSGNPPSDGNYVIAPERLTWFAVYEFDPSGYVSDRDKIDPDKLFADLKANEQTENERRKALGMSGLVLDRWSVAPHYDGTNHNLEWATEMHDETGAKVVNYTSRILGRGGVMRAILVSDPNSLSRDLPKFRNATAAFSYLPSKKYEEFTEGDKMAAYGVGALVTGGAAAAVVKTGLFAGIFATLAKFGAIFFKVIIVGGAAAVLAGFNRLKRMFGGGSDDA